MSKSSSLPFQEKTEKEVTAHYQSLNTAAGAPGSTTGHSRKASMNASKPTNKLAGGASGPASCTNKDKPKSMYETADGFCRPSFP